MTHHTSLHYASHVMSGFGSVCCCLRNFKSMYHTWHSGAQDACTFVLTAISSLSLTKHWRSCSSQPVTISRATGESSTRSIRNCHGRRNHVLFANAIVRERVRMSTDLAMRYNRKYNPLTHCYTCALSLSLSFIHTHTHTHTHLQRCNLGAEWKMTPLFLLKPLADIHIIYIYKYDIYI